MTTSPKEHWKRIGILTVNALLDCEAEFDADKSKALLNNNEKFIRLIFETNQPIAFRSKHLGKLGASEIWLPTTYWHKILVKTSEGLSIFSTNQILNARSFELIGKLTGLKSLPIHSDKVEMKGRGLLANIPNLRELSISSFLKHDSEATKELLKPFAKHELKMHDCGFDLKIESPEE
ncbi:MAG: hypothetical protein CMO80_06110 [Verrucomicrobiales bacterium]|nr:hypothetical protein [Verrucomicrobiales bacterium]